MDKIVLTLDKPIVDANLEPLELSKHFIKSTEDESKHYEVTIEVNNMDMAPTAIFFSLKPRANIDFDVKMSNFKGSDLIYSFLKSGHIREIYYE